MEENKRERIIEDKREKGEDEDEEDKNLREKGFLSGNFFACGGPYRCTMASHPRPCFKGMLEWMCEPWATPTTPL